MHLVDTIFISSIVKKAGTFRHDLKKSLERNDFTPVTFEFSPRHSAEQGYHAQDECLLMINGCDALIGIIDQDPGMNYHGKLLENILPNLPGCPEKITVTAAEIVYAKHVLKIPTLVMLMPYVKNNWETGRQLTVISDFITYWTKQPTDNFFYTDVYSVDLAIEIITQKVGFVQKNRLKLLGNAMSGPNWNGVDFFDNCEVTIRNKLRSNMDALMTLTKEGNTPLGTREIRLVWILNLLNPKGAKRLNEDEINFLNYYIHCYAGYYKQKGNHREQVIDENKAVNLLNRLNFDNSDVFCGYKHSRHGKEGQLLKWPNDSGKWSAPGRVEFILYALLMENMPPPKLRPIADFNAAHESVTGEGFTAHYSRKPVTVGCQNAADVRLTRHNATRGIDVEKEMKSMLYLAYTGRRYCLIAVHGKGNAEVNEKFVLKEFCNAYETTPEKLEVIYPKNLEMYLEKVDSPILGKIYKGKKLSKYGAQELISLFASSINPVSIFMSVRYKYEYLLEKHIDSAFDVLMLWDKQLFDLDECYNNAGSPTWGMRFNPSEMFEHVKKNLQNIEDLYMEKGMPIKFQIFRGEYF